MLAVTDVGSQLKKAVKIANPGWIELGQNWSGSCKKWTEWTYFEPCCQWQNCLLEVAVKLVKSTLDLTLASQSSLNYAEIDTSFSSVANTVNIRPIAVRSHVVEDLHTITPIDLLLGRTRNTVPEPIYSTE